MNQPQALCRLRRMRRNSKQAIQNAREDVRVASFTDSPARMPRRDRQRRLIAESYLHRASLPPALIALLQKALA